MATLVCFHAHPDDECIATGGVMRKAHDEGHRVVLVVATRGEHGEVDEGFLEAGEELWQRRVQETQAAAAILGADRVEFLGYVDSGMMGTPENDKPGSFWTADLDEAAHRLAAILEEEDADVLTIYDDHGGYGHPDHIQVHRVGAAAAAIAGTERVFQSTMNRDHILRGMTAAMERARESGVDGVPDLPDLGEDFGSPETASQISEQSFFLSMPDDAFASGFGTEWFIRDGQGPGITETDLLAGLS